MKQDFLNTIYNCIIIILILAIIYTSQKAKIDCVVNSHTVPFYTKRKINYNNGNLYGVPLNIYQSWYSNQVPPKMKETIDELIEMNPEFDHYLYSDDSSAKFIEENFDKEVVDAFHTLKPGAYKSDLWRYCILYKIGGVYLDIKFITLKPLLQIVKEHPIMFVNDILDNCKNSVLRRGLYNAFIISPPNNEVFKYCIAEIVKNCNLRLYKSNTLHVSGPCLLREIVEKHMRNYKPPYMNYDNKASGQSMIRNEKEVVCIGYKDYRDEQKFSQKTDHYSVLWEMKDIYN